MDNNALFREIQKSISEPNKISYSDIVRMFRDTNEWEMIYKNDKESRRINVEHLFPRSFFGDYTDLNYDLHHLFPVDYYTNEIRANYRFDDKMKDKTFIPPNKDKGLIARALMYVFTRYPKLYDFGILTFDLIVKWNRKYPVTNNEIKRNNLIENIQGNRNPYIDNPSLIDTLISHS